MTLTETIALVGVCAVLAVLVPVLLVPRYSKPRDRKRPIRTYRKARS